MLLQLQSIMVKRIPEQIGKYKISIILKDYLGETEDINKVIEIKDDTYEYSFSATPSESINLGESINLKAYENDALEYSFLAEKGNEVKTLNDNISIASFNKLKIYTDKDSIIEQYVKNNNFDYIINGQDYKNNNSNKDDDNNIGKDDTVDKDDVTDKNDTSNNDDITDKGHDTDKDEGNIEDKGEDIKKPSVGDNEEPKKEGDNSNILLLMAALILTLPILIKRKNILKKYK